MHASCWNRGRVKAYPSDESPNNGSSTNGNDHDITWQHPQETRMIIIPGLRRKLLCLLGVVAISALGAALVLWLMLRASLPQLQGRVPQAGLSGPVSISRDALGVPAIRGKSRRDVAYALGFAHAQDRFFQMDLLRRSAAGEMAALIGATALPLDRQRRLHRFRQRAVKILAELPDADRALLDHYSAGVNAGLASLGSRPFEYWLLRTQPQPWQATDSLLAVHAMYFDLQGHQAPRELARGWLAEHSNPAQLAFLLPEASRWDVPLDAAPLPPPAALPDTPPAVWRGPILSAGQVLLDESLPGSNAWALAGERTASGQAMLANDMHLGLRLPNIWYRALLEYTGADAQPRRVVGVTLPGVPVVVAGSNGHVAWGFTNSYGDWLDLIRLQAVADDPRRYHTASGTETLSTTHETLAVNQGKAETLPVEESRWGPVWRVGGAAFALRWLAHDGVQAVNLRLLGMENASTVAEALQVGHAAGLPTQSLLVADAAGQIGWTLAGPLPRRISPGLHTRFPQPSSAPHLGWRQHLAPADYPSIVQPAGGQLWAANSRPLLGTAPPQLGDGGGDLGARAKQIHQSLSALQAADPQAVFKLALDDRAVLLAEWQQRLTALLDADALQNHPLRQQAARHLQGWEGRASAGSVAYRIVRQWRQAVYGGLFANMDAALGKIQPGLSYQDANARWEVVADTLLRQQPAAWLPPGYRDWRDFQLARLDIALQDMASPKNSSAPGESLSTATWGEQNRARIQHPFVRIMPTLGAWLSAPADPLPGDANLPRVQMPSFGASQRMLLIPGREADSLFHMPGGQSGHPLSPYFLAGHADWVQGRPTPLLPGNPRHVLHLVPSP